MNDAILVHDPDDRPGRYRIAALGDALAMRGFDVDVRFTSTDPVRAAIVVIDSATTRADDTRLYRADRIIGIDTLRRDLDVDLLVDPTIGARTEPHRSARYVVAGASYTLVNPLLGDTPTRPLTDTVKHVVVALEDCTARPVLDELHHALGDTTITTGERDHRRIADADLVICPPGPDLLAALTLGRPTILAYTDPDPYGEHRAIADAGAALVTPLADVADTAAALARNPERRASLAAEARNLLDGLGVTRVAEEVARLSALVL